MKKFVLAVASIATVGLINATPAYAADAHVSVLHGVPDATVDVFVNGKEVLSDFKPGTLTDPLTLPEGTYDLKVVAPNAGADGAAIIEAKGVAVPGGANITVVAHLDAAGKPVLTPFVNDTSTLEAGKGRLTVRHVAAAPAVDVRAGGAVAFANLTNPNEAKAHLPVGTIKADVVLAGTDTVALGPADVPVTAHTNTIVYAWGSAEGKNLALAVQTVKVGSKSPSGVPAGEGPDAVTLGALLVLGTAVGAGTFAASRRKAA